MTYSNTISQTVFTTNRLLQSSVRRTKIPAELLTAETWDIAKDELFLFLSDLANQGAPLWCIEKQLYPLYDGVGALTLDVGTVDVLNSYFRTLPEVTGTDTDTSTSHKTQFTSATPVSTVGIAWTAASVPIEIARSDDGVTWTVVQTETPSAAAGEVTWYDLTSVVASTYIRLRATTGTLGFDYVYWGNNPQQIPLARLNRDDWTNLPNQFFKSDRVLQYWFDRQTPQPIMRFWPIPSDGAINAQIVVWRHRQIMDVGTLTQEIEVPQRWYEAVVAGLAARLALALPDAKPEMIPILDQKAAVAMNVAQTEERDNSSTTWAPNLSYYTA